MFAAIFNFLSLGDSISRYTWANVSKPLIASKECPKATMMTTNDNVDHQVPYSQPRPFSGSSSRLAGVGKGGICAGPLVNNVTAHQIRKITIMTVMTCMMRSAFVLDSWIPLMFAHQK